MKIIYCGGCNPLYKRVEVYEKIKNELLKLDLEYEYLILNGCHRGCRKVDLNCKTINVQDFFNQSTTKNWTEEEIIKWIYKKIKIGE